MRKYTLLPLIFCCGLFASTSMLAQEASKQTDKSKEPSVRSETGEKSTPTPDLTALSQKLKAAVAAGEMTEKEAYSKYIEAAGTKGDKKMMAGKMNGKGHESFYAIVIGRLESKDLELGEFTLRVDYITSIYGDRRLKDSVLNNSVKVTGVSGPWLDKLLVVKPGQTLKFRSGTLIDSTFSLSPKATVLEQATAFDPATYPIPPEPFRGFQGVVIGTVESKSDQGYDMTIRVSEVTRVEKESAASEPNLIVGRLMDLQGFYANEFCGQFDALQIGDKVRVGAAHRVPEIDALEVTRLFKKVEK